jgi:thymidylate synthase
MQIMRSNDLFLGTPYNFLQFTTLQEVLAGWLGVGLGSYHHLSDSLHAYVRAADTFGFDPSLQVAANTDSLLLPREASEAAFAVLNQRFGAMTRGELTLGELDHLVVANDIPATYRNMLRIVGAEAARRRRWPEAADRIASGCTNPVLKQVWERWVKRLSIPS